MLVGERPSGSGCDPCSGLLSSPIEQETELRRIDDVSTCCRDGRAVMPRHRSSDTRQGDQATVKRMAPVTRAAAPFQRGDASEGWTGRSHHGGSGGSLAASDETGETRDAIVVGDHVPLGSPCPAASGRSEGAAGLGLGWAGLRGRGKGKFGRKKRGGIGVDCSLPSPRRRTCDGGQPLA